MPAKCSPPVMQFARVDGHSVVAEFSGGVMTSVASSLAARRHGPGDRTGGSLRCLLFGRVRGHTLAWCMTSPSWWASGALRSRWATRT